MYLGVEEQEYRRRCLVAVPGITGYIVQENDSLWDIAKTISHATADHGDEQSATGRGEKGDRIILMKKVVIN